MTSIHCFSCLQVSSFPCRMGLFPGSPEGLKDWLSHGTFLFTPDGSHLSSVRSPGKNGKALRGDSSNPHFGLYLLYVSGRFLSLLNLLFLTNLPWFGKQTAEAKNHCATWRLTGGSHFLKTQPKRGTVKPRANFSNLSIAETHQALSLCKYTQMNTFRTV